MNDLISRAAAIESIRECAEAAHSNYEWDMEQGYLNAIECIEEEPSAQPERETAKFIRWMECKRTADYISYTPHCKCSKCGTEFLIETIKYCYMCGARMER